MKPGDAVPKRTATHEVPVHLLGERAQHRARAEHLAGVDHGLRLGGCVAPHPVESPRGCSGCGRARGRARRAGASRSTRVLARPRAARWGRPATAPRLVGTSAAEARSAAAAKWPDSRSRSSSAAPPPRPTSGRAETRRSSAASPGETRSSGSSARTQSSVAASATTLRTVSTIGHGGVRDHARPGGPRQLGRSVRRSRGQAARSRPPSPRTRGTASACRPRCGRRCRLRSPGGKGPQVPASDRPRENARRRRGEPSPGPARRPIPCTMPAAVPPTTRASSWIAAQRPVSSAGREHADPQERPTRPASGRLERSRSRRRNTHAAPMPYP